MKKEIRNVTENDQPIDPRKESLKKIELRANGRKRVTTVPVGPSCTQQQFKKQTDINNIMARYAKTGQLPADIIRQGTYADVSQIPDLLEATRLVNQAHIDFMALPPEIRNKVQNDPTKLVAYLQDPANDAEAVRLGLKVKKETAPEPTPAASKPGSAPQEASGNQA